jgi:hypothetical protein
MAPLMRIVAPGLILAVALQSTSALAQNTPGQPLPAAAHRTAHYLSVKVWEGGAVAPNVNVRVPTALVSTVVALATWSGILDRSIEAAREHGCPHANGGMRINLTGRQIASLWSDIVSGGPADLVRVEDGSDRVVVRLE